MAILIIFCIIGVALFKLSKILFGSYLAPLSVYAFFCCIQVVLFQLKLIEYYDLSPFTIICVLLGLISFSFGAVLIGILPHKKVAKPHNYGLPFQYRKKSLRKWVIVLSLLGLFGSIWYFYGVMHHFGSLSAFLLNPNATRAESVFGELANVVKNKYISSYLFSLNYVAAILSAYYMIKISYRFIPIYVPILSLILYSFCFLGRSAIINGLLYYFVTISLVIIADYKRLNIVSYIKQHKSSFFTFCVLAVIPVGFIVWFLGELLGKYEWSTTYSTSCLPPLVIHIYDYFCSPLGGLNYHLNNWNGQFLFGWASFYPLFYAFFKVGLFEDYNTALFLFEGVRVPNYTNVAPAILHFFVDFGFAGVVFIPLLLGFASSYVYKSYLGRPSFGKLTMLVQLYLAIMFSNMGWKFWNMFFWQIFFWGILVAFFLKKGKWRFIGLKKTPAVKKSHRDISEPVC